jgi:sterol desaturase/sphingolipid hydroxylase (fatty acid hydroxylase superfamily)
MASGDKMSKMQVREVVKRLKDKDIDLVIDPAAFEYLSKGGYNPQYGARPLRRLIQTKILTPVANLVIGLVKGAVFGFSIALVACHFGLKVRPNTESLSSHTTTAVVSAITAVIIIDAIFAIFTRNLGLPQL